MRPVVIHISNDYPDPLLPDKTRAVKALIDGTSEHFHHIVYSLNRINGWSGLSHINFGEDRVAIAYKALPKGLFWEERLKNVADWIKKDLLAKNITPDLFAAHKFTVEGLIVEQLARDFEKPFVCDIQGDTDTNILQKKPSLRRRYKDIAKRAAVIFPYSPWPLKTFHEMINLDPAKCRLLPVVPGFDHLKLSNFVQENRLLSVFNIDSWNRKNVSSVILAMKNISSLFPDISLDIYGRGKASSLAAVKKFINRSGMSHSVHLKGPAENNSLPEIMSKYAAFVQPSKRETYGLVYAEALFSGLPILFSKNRGIDGYLETSKIGYAADPHSIHDIAHGITYLLTHQKKLKSSIANLQLSGQLDLIRQNSILKTYREGLSQALAK